MDVEAIENSREGRKRNRSETPEKIKRIRGDSNSKVSKRVQKYRKEWQDNPNRSRWLRPVLENLTRAQCILCNTEFKADISVINKHAEGKSHIKIAQGIMIIPSSYYSYTFFFIHHIFYSFHFFSF